MEQRPKFLVVLKLDHFLVSKEWEDHFSSPSQFVLPKSVFDHCPILVKGGGVKKGKTPFKFNNMWLQVHGFKDLIRSW